jgi:cell division inhibitor SepF
MSLVDKFKGWFLVDNNVQDSLNDDDEDYNDTEDDNESVNTSTTNASTSTNTNASTHPSYGEGDDRDYDDGNRYGNHSNQNYGNPNRPNENRNYINVNARLEVVLVKPEVFTDAKQVADHLMKQKTVVLNLENAKPENKRRIIDFLAGVAYAKGGSIKAVANLTYIITPCGVGFVGDDLVGELENSGVIV